jgi:hypothetical protein
VTTDPRLGKVEDFGMGVPRSCSYSDVEQLSVRLALATMVEVVVEINARLYLVTSTLSILCKCF